MQPSWISASRKKVMNRIFCFAACLSLGACDSGGVVDQTVRHSVRQSAVAACQQWIPQLDVTAATGLDPGRLCGCAADRIMAGKNASDLANNTPGMPEVRAAVLQCVANFNQKPGSSAQTNDW
jgi:hypothetical protein